jgi:hypothetical protein
MFRLNLRRCENDTILADRNFRKCYKANTRQEGFMCQGKTHASAGKDVPFRTITFQVNGFPFRENYKWALTIAGQ